MNKVSQVPTGNADQKAKIPRAQKFARLIKKGRNNQVKFRAFRSSATFRRLRRSLRHPERRPNVVRHSVVKHDNYDRFSILKAPCTSEDFIKRWKLKTLLFSMLILKLTKDKLNKPFFESFNVKPQRVNAMNCITGEK